MTPLPSKRDFRKNENATRDVFLAFVWIAMLGARDLRSPSYFIERKIHLDIMRMVSPTSSIVFLGILFVDTVSNGVSEAFVTLQYNIARITPRRSLTLSGLAFHPQKAKDSEFHTPAESFTFTRHAEATISSEYVQSEWKEDDSSKRLSYLDVISSAASVSNSFDQKQDAIDLDTSNEPIAQAHRIQQAYREWCEVSNRI